MPEFNLFKYLKHWKAAVALAVVLAFLAGFYVSSHQALVTSINITYTNSGASSKYFADGSPLDVTEIIGADVITAVIEKLHLPMTTETLRNSLAIQEVIPADKKTLIDGAASRGEEYIYNPVEFKISLADTNGLFTKEEAVKVVSTLVDCYIEKYGRDHVDRASIPAFSINAVKGYLDRAELLEQSTEEMVGFLTDMSATDGSFRSNTTGYSFADLKDIYATIGDDDINMLHSIILSETATVDLNVLIYNYQNRITNNGMDIANKEVELQRLKELLDAYVAKAKEQNSEGNTGSSISSSTTPRADATGHGIAVTEQIISDSVPLGYSPNDEYSYVDDSRDDSESNYSSGSSSGYSSGSSGYYGYDGYYHEGNGNVLQDLYDDQNSGRDYTTTYDNAISRYAALRREIYDLNTDIKHCREVLDTYSTCTGNVISDIVDTELDILAIRLSELHTVVKDTLADFDAVRGAKNVKVSSGITQTGMANVKMFVAVGAFGGLCMGIVGLIVLGRGKELLYAYMAKVKENPVKAGAGGDQKEGAEPDVQNNNAPV